MRMGVLKSRLMDPVLETPTPAPLVAVGPQLPLAIDQSPAAVYLATLAPRGRRSQQQALEAIAQLLGYSDVVACPWSRLRYQHTAAIRARLAEAYAPATANRMLCALRRTLEEAWRLGQIDAESYRRAADVKPIKSQTLPAGRALTRDEVAALFAAADATPAPGGPRDACLLAILIGAGLRRSEAAALLVADVDLADRTLVVRSGKGKKDRRIHLPIPAARRIADWLAIRGPAAGALITSTTKPGKKMTDQAIFVILQRLREVAGIAAFTPHDLRRTYITSLLDAGADLSTVQQLAGHAKPETTTRYDRRGDDTKRRAAALLNDLID